MLKYIEEEKKFLEITGFRNLKIENSEEFIKTMRKELPNNAWIQFFNAELVATWQHLYFAVLNAMIAFAQKANISKSMAMETMLYASAQRQIQKAIDLMGVKCSSTNIAVVIVGENFESVHAVLSVISKRVGKEPEDMVLKISEDKKEKIRNSFEIDTVEFETVTKKDNHQEALVDIVIERIALLSTQL